MKGWGHDAGGGIVSKGTETERQLDDAREALLEERAKRIRETDALKLELLRVKATAFDHLTFRGPR